MALGVAPNDKLPDALLVGVPVELSVWLPELVVVNEREGDKVDDRDAVGVREGSNLALVRVLEGVAVGVDEVDASYHQLKVNCRLSVAVKVSIDCTVTNTSVVETSTVQLANAKRPLSVQGSSLGGSLKLRHVIPIRGQMCAIANAGRQVPPRLGHTRMYKVFPVSRAPPKLNTKTRDETPGPTRMLLNAQFAPKVPNRSEFCARGIKSVMVFHTFNGPDVEEGHDGERERAEGVPEGDADGPGEPVMEPEREREWLESELGAE